MDELDLLRLQKANKVAEDNTNDDEDEDEESVDFNEEEVLQRCQDFQKDYQERKNNQKQQPQPPIPKPRQFISGRPLSEPPKPSVRTRSSSLTLHDKTNDTDLEQNKVENIVFPKPILKKSSDDISARTQNEARPILKRKDSESSLVAPGSENTPPVSKVSSSGTTTGGGILKRKSVTDDNSLPTISKQEHVRIRSPSPDLELRPILRSRNSSLGKKCIFC